MKLHSGLINNMDQEAFRALLSTPRDTPSTSTRAFGVRHKRVAETSAPAEKSTLFKPRPQAPKKGKSKKDKPEGEGSASASQYVDRAALRRQGLDHDYSHVDQLKAELEARNGEDELDNEQMQYLVCLCSLAGHTGLMSCQGRRR